MEGSQVISFIQSENLIYVPVLYIIGMVVKSSVTIKDKYIPMIMLALGVIICLFTRGLSIDSFAQGVLIGGVPTFINQLYKQTTSKE